MNGYLDISDDTKRRVIAAAAKLNYHAHSAARALVKGQSSLMGIIIFRGGLFHPFFNGVVQGAIAQMETSGKNAIVTQLSGRYTTSEFARRVHERRLEGIVVMGISDKDADILDLSECGIPVMFVDALVSSATSSHVHSDNVTGGRVALQHLIELGHSHIAYVDEASSAVIFEHRKSAFTESALKGDIIGYEFAPSLPIWEESFPLAVRAYESGATAVLAATDMQALAMIEGLRQRNLSVPRDMSIVGFDDIELSSYSSPPLTTIRQHCYDMGRLAVCELIKMCSSNSCTSSMRLEAHTLPVELRVRESTAPPRH